MYMWLYNTYIFKDNDLQPQIGGVLLNLGTYKAILQVTILQLNFNQNFN